MKLDKAIEIQEGALKDKWCPWSQDLKDSIKLGIEAGKRIQSYRKDPIHVANLLLPGETESL